MFRAFEPGRSQPLRRTGSDLPRGQHYPRRSPVEPHPARYQPRLKALARSLERSSIRSPRRAYDSHSLYSQHDRPGAASAPDPRGKPPRKSQVRSHAYPPQFPHFALGVHRIVDAPHPAAASRTGGARDVDYHFAGPEKRPGSGTRERLPRSRHRRPDDDQRTHSSGAADRGAFRGDGPHRTSRNLPYLRSPDLSRTAPYPGFFAPLWPQPDRRRTEPAWLP